MKADIRYPVTAAIHFLRDHGVAFTPHMYKYEERGGTAVSARELGVNENIVIKTLVLEDDKKLPFIILMHGDKQVSLKELARQIGAKSVKPCKPEVANRHSGYQVGGTSPFGLRKPIPLFAEASILELPEIYINGGGRGFLVRLSPADLVRTLDPKPVQVAIADPR